MVAIVQAGLDTGPSARLALAQRIAALAIFLMLNAVTPFITPDPPWLANLPLLSRSWRSCWPSACRISAPRGRVLMLEIPKNK